MIHTSSDGPEEVISNGDLSENKDVQTPQIYIFTYGLGNKTISGYKIDTQKYRNPEQISAIKPSELEKNQVHSGWIKFANDKYTKSEMQTTEPGKWVLRFPKGSPDLDAAWQKLCEGIASGFLWDIKVSAKNGDYPTQVICVYNKDARDKLDALRIYEYLEKKGVLALHMQQDINGGIIRYKSDEATRQDSAKDEVGTLYTNQDMIELRLFHKEQEQFRHYIVEKLVARIGQLEKDRDNIIDKNSSAYNKVDAKIKALDDIKHSILNNIKITVTEHIQSGRKNHLCLEEAYFNNETKFLNELINNAETYISGPDFIKQINDILGQSDDSNITAEKQRIWSDFLLYYQSYLNNSNEFSRSRMVESWANDFMQRNNGQNPFITLNKYRGTGVLGFHFKPTDSMGLLNKFLAFESIPSTLRNLMDGLVVGNPDVYKKLEM